MKCISDALPMAGRHLLHFGHESNFLPKVTYKIKTRQKEVPLIHQLNGKQRTQRAHNAFIIYMMSHIKEYEIHHLQRAENLFSQW